MQVLVGISQHLLQRVQLALQATVKLDHRIGTHVQRRAGSAGKHKAMRSEPGRRPRGASGPGVLLAKSLDTSFAETASVDANRLARHKQGDEVGDEKPQRLCFSWPARFGGQSLPSGSSPDYRKHKSPPSKCDVRPPREGRRVL